MNTAVRLANDQTEATTSAAVGPRVDLYCFVHKGLRAFMCDALTRVGRTDGNDHVELSETLNLVSDLLDMCESHLQHENNFIHPALEARQPGSSLVTAQNHDDHEDSLRVLRQSVEAIRIAQDNKRGRAIADLYRLLARFVAENFEHMHEEETANNAVLWAHYNDGEINDILRSLMATVSPHAYSKMLRWTVPHISANERAAMFIGMKLSRPAPAFAQVLAHIKPHLAENEWNKLMAALAGV